MKNKAQNKQEEKSNTYKKIKTSYITTSTTVVVVLLLTLMILGSSSVSLPLTYAQNATESASIFTSSEDTNAGDIIPGQFILTVRNETMLQEALPALSDAAEQSDLKVVNTFPNLGVLVLNGSENSVPALSDAAEQNDTGVVIEANRIVTALGQTLPTGINRIDAESSSSSSSSSAATSNTMSTNQTKMSNLDNVQIGIIDTGIDLKNEELNVVSDVSFVPGEPTGQDGNGHGTHVSGIAAAKDDSDGVVGVAPGAKLTAIKVLSASGSGSTASVLAGLDYALQHANELDVVNLSLGGPGTSVATNTAITKLQRAGVPVVVAAGNDNEDAAFFSPANAPDAWTVSSILDTDGKCGGLGGANDDSFLSFSNYGSVVEIAAPGGKINSTIPGGKYAQFSGTSMAAPHVAGAVALYKSSHPDASPAEIFNKLIEAANKSDTACDTAANNGKGYIKSWTFDRDNIREPLLYVKEFVTTK